MFGYLFPKKDSLTLCERKIFRNYFCSLCLAQRYRYGWLASLLSNYETTFLAISLQLYDNDAEDCGRCGKYIKHRRKKFTKMPWSAFADYNVNTIRIKLRDNIHDEHSFFSAIIYTVFYGVFRKSRRYNGELYGKFDESFKEIEAAECASYGIHKMMDVYASFVEQTVRVIMEPDPNRLQFLKSIARWLYWIDAVQDYESDLKKHRFNPLIKNPERDSTQVLFLEYNTSALINDFLVIKRQIDQAYSCCSYFSNNRVIIENILDYTIVDVTKRVLNNQPLEKKGRLL